ncbi:hypothetical protein ABZ281_17020 [Streptomyces sp. NPDC006265]|uniref:hypothetical protein n=1 Tax=Streptomyces sp. NPDC006265 TaxID=3156740 RepID=UPI0033BF905E
MTTHGGTGVQEPVQGGDEARTRWRGELIDALARAGRRRLLRAGAVAGSGWSGGALVERGRGGPGGGQRLQ